MKAHTLKKYVHLLRGTNPLAIREELFKIDDFKRRLDTNPSYNECYSKMASELFKALACSMQNSYGKNWGLYLDLARMPSNNKMGISQVETSHSFKESISWIVSADGKPTERFQMLSPAILYKDNYELGIGKPKMQFNSIKGILDYNFFEGSHVLMMPEVLIDGKKDSLRLEGFSSIFPEYSKFFFTSQGD